MKINLIAVTSMFSLVACVSQNDTSTSANSIGGNKDEKGCLVAAGQTWSELRKTCIQVFNDGIRLNPTETKKDEAIFSAFIVYNQDKSKAELFLPDQKPTVILNKKNNVYSDNDYSFDTNEMTLSFRGKVIYKK